MFRATKVNADLFEYVYASQFRVSIPCNNFRPVVSKTDISRVDKTRTKFKDDFQRLSDFFLSSARQQTCQEGDLTIRQASFAQSLCFCVDANFSAFIADCAPSSGLLVIVYAATITAEPPLNEIPRRYRDHATVRK